MSVRSAGEMTTLNFDQMCYIHINLSRRAYAYTRRGFEKKINPILGKNSKNRVKNGFSNFDKNVDQK